LIVSLSANRDLLDNRLPVPNKERGMKQPQNASPLSDYWVVEYHFISDSFSVRPLPDHLAVAERSIKERRLFDCLILAVHPTKQGAQEVCEGWQERRNEKPIAIEKRIAELNRYIDGLKQQL
jgi:hypothetical protein